MIKRQIIKYTAVGIGSNLVNFSVFSLLYAFLHVNYLLAAGTGYLTGMYLGFLFNGKWTFKVEKPSVLMLIKYFSIYFFTLMLVLLTLYVLVNFAEFNTYIAYAVVIVIAVGSNFFGMKFWVFNK